MDELPVQFRVLLFAPSPGRNAWTYATECMSMRHDANPIELHMLAPEPNDGIVELLAVTAHYHRTETWLGLGHSVNFGRPWWDRSSCDHGLISLPYLDGPKLEWLVADEFRARFLWLIPITSSEVEFKRTQGLEKLERRFEQMGLDYLNPVRPSVV